MENVHHPKHYDVAVGGIQVRDLIDFDGLFGEGFWKWSAVKYILRAGKKSESTTVEDLMKSRRCLEYCIDLIQNERGWCRKHDVEEVP